MAERVLQRLAKGLGRINRVVLALEEIRNHLSGDREMLAEKLGAYPE